MNFRVSFILVFVLLHFSIFGQQKKASISFSNDQIVENAKSYEEDLGRNLANRIILFNGKNYFSVDSKLRKYDLEFKLIDSELLTKYQSDKDVVFNNYFHRLGQKSNEYLYSGFIPIDNKFIVTTYNINKKLGKTLFSGGEISYDNIHIVNDNKNILERDFTKAKMLVGSGNYHQNNLIKNNSNSFYLFYELGDKGGLNINADLFDSNLSKKFNINENFNTIKGTIFIQDIFLSENGTLYIGVTGYEGLKMPSNKYNHYIIEINETTKNLIPISPTSNNITEFKISQNSSGDVVILGFTSNKNYTDFDITGTYFSKINSGKIENEKYSNFNSDFISLYNGKSNSINSCQLLKVFCIDNNFYVIGEQRKIKSVGAGGSSNSAFMNHYYEDIIICKLNNDGESEWNRKIDKTQERDITANSGNLIEMSVGIENIGDNIVLVYADNNSNISKEYSETGDNFNVKDFDYLKDGYNGYVVCASVINKSGGISVNKLDKTKLNKFRLLPYNTFKKDENSIIFYLDNVDTKVSSKTSYKFATLTIE